MKYKHQLMIPESVDELVQLDLVRRGSRAVGLGTLLSVEYKDVMWSIQAACIDDWIIDDWHWLSDVVTATSVYGTAGFLVLDHYKWAINSSSRVKNEVLMKLYTSKALND